MSDPNDRQAFLNLCDMAINNMYELEAIGVLSIRYEPVGSYTEPYKIPDKDGQHVLKPQRLSKTLGYAVYCRTISKGLYFKT